MVKEILLRYLYDFAAYVDKGTSQICLCFILDRSATGSSIVEDELVSLGSLARS